VGRQAAADYGMQVLSRILAYGVDPMGVLHNACEGIKRLYSGERSEIIWTGADIEQLKKHCTKEIGHAIDLRPTQGCARATCYDSRGGMSAITPS